MFATYGDGLLIRCNFKFAFQLIANYTLVCTYVKFNCRDQPHTVYLTCYLFEHVQVAVTLGTNIMSEDWVNECWRRRNEFCAFATDPELMIHKQLPFKGLTIALFGFTSEDEQHMKETANDNGTYIYVHVL